MNVHGKLKKHDKSSLRKSFTEILTL